MRATELPEAQTKPQIINDKYLARKSKKEESAKNL